MAIFASPVFSQYYGKRTKYADRRFDEDWSGLAEEGTGDFFDPIKHFPLTEDGSSWLSLGGQERIQVKTKYNAKFIDNDDDTFALYRLRLHGDFHFGSHVRVFAEGKSALATDTDLAGRREASDVDELDLQNAFIDLSFPLTDDCAVTLRGGRQELSFGARRLVSPLDWANTRRTFEGYSAIFKFSSWNVTGFWSRPVLVDRYHFNVGDADTEFFGVYGTTRLESIRGGIDLYWFGLDRGNVAFNGTTGTEERSTIGTRVWGKIMEMPVIYQFETAYQFGDIGAENDIGSGSIDAYMFASQIGYRFLTVYGAPQVFLGFDYASGDNQAGGDVETFNQLFPLGHRYYGYYDAVGRQNAVDIRPGVTATLFEKLWVKLDFHFFSRADSADALYNAGGNVVRAGNLGSSKEIAQELDLLARYNYNRHIQILFGYSHVFAGEFLEQSGAAEDIDFIYLQFQYTF